MNKVQTMVGVYYRVPKKRAMFRGKADKCYYITYTVDGKKTWEKVGYLSEGYSAQLAQTVRGERLRAIRHGEELPKSKNKTLQDIWKKVRVIPAPSQVEIIDRLMATHFKSIAVKRVTAITELEIAKLKKEMSASGLRPTTMGSYLTSLKFILSKAHELGCIKKMVNQKAFLLKGKNKGRTRYLTKEEAGTLFRELHKLKNKNFYYVSYIALATGLRISEILTLKSENIDLNERTITVIPENEKTNKPRTLLMDDKIFSFLKDILEKRDSGDYVFQTGNNKKIKRRTFAQDGKGGFAVAVRRAGLNDGRSFDDRFVFHSLRHTFASWLAIQGESLYVIKELMGHSSITMTERYAHLCPDNKNAAIKRHHEMLNRIGNKNVIPLNGTPQPSRLQS